MQFIFISLNNSKIFHKVVQILYIYNVYGLHIRYLNIFHVKKYNYKQEHFCENEAVFCG